MKAAHAITARAGQTPASGPVVTTATPAPSAALSSSWARFWFSPVDPIGLHVLRILAGLLFLAWLVPFAGSLEAFFGSQGWLDQQAYAQTSRLPDALPQEIGWSGLFLGGIWANPTQLALAYWTAIAALVLFTLGICPRLTGIISWLAVVSFSVNPGLAYEADVLLGIFAFYLMLGYVLLGRKRPEQGWLAFLFDSRAWLFGRWAAATGPSEGEGTGSRSQGPDTGGVASVGANLALRLLQVHLAIVIVAGATHKLQSGDWWAGVALWYWLYPPFETTLAQARTHAAHGDAYLFALSLTAYAILAWQLAFPFFAWRPRWRPLLIGGGIVGWLGLSLLYRLPLLGPIFFVMCLSYVSAQEWRRLLAALGRLGALSAGKGKRSLASAAGPHQGSLVENHA